MAVRSVNIDHDTPMPLPSDLRDWVSPDHMVHFIMDAVDALDLSMVRINQRDTGNAQHPPSMVLGLLIYCYATGTFASRRIEALTHENLAVRYLCANTYPDHDSICEFRRKNKDLLSDAFHQVLELAVRAGVLQVGDITVAIDGTKILAHASKHSAVNYGQAIEQMQLATDQISELLAKAETADSTPLQDGLTVPDDVIRREDRVAKLGEARQAMEERAKERLLEERPAVKDLIDRLKAHQTEVRGWIKEEKDSGRMNPQTTNAEKARLFAEAARNGPIAEQNELTENEQAEVEKIYKGGNFLNGFQQKGKTEDEVRQMAEDLVRAQRKPADQPPADGGGHEPAPGADVLSPEEAARAAKLVKPNGDVWMVDGVDAYESEAEARAAAEAQVREDRPANPNPPADTSGDSSVAVEGSKDVRFNEKEHSYEGSGGKVTGLTSALDEDSQLGSKSGKRTATEEAKLKRSGDAGTLGHKKITDALVEHEKTGKFPVSPMLKNAIRAILAVPGRDEKGKFIVEKPMYHGPTDKQAKGYAGIPDILVPLKSGGYHLIELTLKSDMDANPHDAGSKFHKGGLGFVAPAIRYGVQMIGQSRLVRANGHDVKSGSVLAFDSQCNPLRKKGTKATDLYTYENTHHVVDLARPDLVEHADRIYGKESGVNFLGQGIPQQALPVVPQRSAVPTAPCDGLMLYPPEMLEPGGDVDSDYDDDPRDRELLTDDLASDNDDFSRSEEDGWFYSDEDSGIDTLTDSDDWED